MSFVWGSWFFLAIAAKNCDSEGYTHLSPSSRGIEEVSRSVERFPGARECGGGWLPPSLCEERKRDQGDEEDWWSTGHLSADDGSEAVLWSTGQPPAFEGELEWAEWSTGHDMDVDGGCGS